MKICKWMLLTLFLSNNVFFLSSAEPVDRYSDFYKEIDLKIRKAMCEYSNLLFFTHIERQSDFLKMLGNTGMIPPRAAEFDSEDDPDDEDSEDEEGEFYKDRDDYKDFVTSINWDAMISYFKAEKIQQIICICTRTCLQRGYIEEKSDWQALSFLISREWGASCPCGNKDPQTNHSKHEYRYDMATVWQMLQPNEFPDLLKEEVAVFKTREQHPHFYNSGLR